MFQALRKILFEVQDSPDLEQALTMVVRSAKQAVAADACSVYLIDYNTRELVLQATDGLRPEAVGNVRLSMYRGLVGLSVERAEPVNIHDASAHPRYVLNHDTGEEEFLGFLSTPIIQNRSPLGALVVRKRDPKSFGDDQMAFVMALASQLTGTIMYATWNGELGRLQGYTVSEGWDIFLSHASEDKVQIAKPLADALISKGLRVWFDDFSLSVGDSLRRSIDKGLSSSRFGIVVISRNFLEKEWPQKELDSLVAREVDGNKVILPVWHNIDVATIRRHSPLLADRVATNSSKGVDCVVRDLLKAIKFGD